MRSIKERFLRIMEEKRITQTELAEKMGKPQSSVSRMFKTDGPISQVDYYRALHELTGCNLNWVIAGIGEKYLVNEPAGGYMVAEPMADYNVSVRTLNEGLRRIVSNYEIMKEENRAIKEKLAQLEKIIRKL